MGDTVTTKQETTKGKILDAAEALFAEHGFAETSLRLITNRAEVNLASVNYHFGSKKSLIEAVFERFMDLFTRELSKEMDKLESQIEPLEVEQLLNAMVQPLMQVEQLRPNGSSVFMKFLSRAYSETQGHIRRFAMEKYMPVYLRFTCLLGKACTSAKPSDMFWQLHFMLGTFVFTLAGHEALQEISKSDFNEPVELEQILSKLISFLAAGFERTPGSQ